MLLDYAGVSKNKFMIRIFTKKTLPEQFNSHYILFYQFDATTT